MKNFTTGTTAIFDKIIDIMAIGGAVILVGMALLVSADVVMTYFFSSPIEHVLEFTEYSLVYVTFLSAAWILKIDRHVKMEGVLNQLSPRTRLLINFITSILGAIVCVILFWYGFRGAWDYFQRGLSFPGGPRIPQTPVLAPIVIAYLLLFIQFLRRSYEFLTQWRVRKIR